jgi:ribosomal protein S18 acetylase RimI-like enzyme
LIEIAGWTIRPVRRSDAADLQRNCFSGQSLRAVADYLAWCLAQSDKGRMVRLVVELEGEVIASGQLAIRHREGEIGSLEVALAYRRKGIGDALLDALMQEARKRDLCAVEIMADADETWLRSWYERRGFVYQDERRLSRGERVAYLLWTLSERSEP